jgi:cytochrome c oxidase subunit 2
MDEALPGLRAALMVLCLLVFLLVFAVMFVSIWQHHRSGAQGKTNFHASVAVEICWALAPFVIVLALVWPTTRLLFPGTYL